MKHSSKRFFGILLGHALLLALVLTFSLSDCAFADVAYNVNIANDIQYGGVTAGKTSAKAGETVTLTATPNTDCSLQEIVAKAGKAETVADIIAAIAGISKWWVLVPLYNPIVLMAKRRNEEVPV